eukprot:TRINITY_DN41075_c0_g1_i1.p1 TRINITY_DN41075_c0_g1~~TRINITY_DN41075_c0_g1_i1.p1  ORF type:complete len:111 (-),score=18.62 TRINITY_DN41075_c0_g1_i1:124-456(-)
MIRRPPRSTLSSSSAASDVYNRQALYGALELVGGTLTNILEGIPITTSDRTVCIARPACIMVISSTLFALLLWKSPNSVRLQPVSYTHLRAHETPEHLVCRLLLEKKKIK